MPETAKLEKFRQLLTIATENLTREEFVQSFKAILTQISKLEEALLKRIDDTLDKKSQAFIDKLTNFLEEGKKILSVLEKDEKATLEGLKSEASKLISKALQTLNEKSLAIDKRLKEVKDGQDADESIIIEKVLERIPKPKDGEPGNDVDPAIVEGLQNELKLLKEEISKIPRKPIGGFKMLRLAEFSFYGDGATTAFTLPHAPAGHGKAVFAFLNGQQIQYGKQFTISGKTLTTTFVMEATDTIEGIIILF